MSSRNFRKLCGSSLPPPGSDDSDGEYDPLANRQKKSTYEGLELTSDSSSGREPEAEEEDESHETGAASLVAQGEVKKKKNKKKKGKGKGKGKKLTAAGDSTSTTESGGANCRALSRYRPAMPGLELDEIDKSLMEVNALLGAPPPAPVEQLAQSMYDEMRSVLSVQAKYLKVTYEVKRLFGPEDPEEIRQRQKTQPHRARVLRRVTVGPNFETPLYIFKNTGLSMSVEKRENGITHFVYDHDQDYQKMHHAFLEKFTQHYMTRGTVLFTLDEARHNMHVEPLLEIADTLCRVEEYRAVNEIVENVMTYLQYVAHPSFNLASQKVRLSYDYIENRPFHVAMLKYMYLLTNKACHRTALEIAKMLLNIDPTDPLAVLFVIDTLAIRAREHQWLIEAIEYFNQQRQANLLFNIQYSYALAHFHVATKNKKELCEADKHLQIAIMSYPQVVLKILEYAYVKEPRIETHALFTNEPRSIASDGLSELIMIYAKLTWSRWREPQVMEWFVKNAIEVTENYNNSQEVRDRVGELAVLRHSIFQSWPSEIMRHISIIRPMANLLLETTLRPLNRPTCSWDPLFEHGINRYSYKAHSEPPRIMSSRGALLYSYRPWDEQSLLMDHLIATEGRTPHAGTFDPLLSVMEQFMPRIMHPLGQRSIHAEILLNNGIQAARDLQLSDSSSSNSGDGTPSTPDSIPNAANTPERHAQIFTLQRVMFDSFRSNGIIPNHQVYAHVPMYALNMFNMINDLIIAENNPENNAVVGANDTDEESELENFLDGSNDENDVPTDDNSKNVDTPPEDSNDNEAAANTSNNETGVESSILDDSANDKTTGESSGGNGTPQDDSSNENRIPVVDEYEILETSNDNETPAVGSEDNACSAEPNKY